MEKLRTKQTLWLMALAGPVVLLLAGDGGATVHWLRTGECPGGPMDRFPTSCGPLEVALVLLGGWAAFLVLPLLVGWWAGVTGIFVLARRPGEPRFRPTWAEVLLGLGLTAGSGGLGAWLGRVATEHVLAELMPVMPVTPAVVAAGAAMLATSVWWVLLTSHHHASPRAWGAGCGAVAGLGATLAGAVATLAFHWRPGWLWSPRLWDLWLGGALIGAAAGGSAAALWLALARRGKP